MTPSASSKKRSGKKPKKTRKTATASSATPAILDPIPSAVAESSPRSPPANTNQPDARQKRQKDRKAGLPPARQPEPASPVLTVLSSLTDSLGLTSLPLSAPSAPAATASHSRISEAIESTIHTPEPPSPVVSELAEPIRSTSGSSAGGVPNTGVPLSNTTSQPHQRQSTKCNDAPRPPDILPRVNNLLTESLARLTLQSTSPLAPPPASHSSSDSPAPRTPQNIPRFPPGPIHDLSNDPTWLLLTKPRILHDSGTGPRVRDARAFLASSFAHPPWTEDPLCAEFARPEMLQMLQTVLPSETAMLLWYNKSRRTARVCPACQRVYNLGDMLSSPIATRTDADSDAPPAEKQTPSTQLLREQLISGLCSPICFFMSSFHNPDAIRPAWGCMAEELDDATWAALDAPAPRDDHGLSMLLKMTRLHDLGLAQLCAPELDADAAVELPPVIEAGGMPLGSRRTSVRALGSSARS